MKRSKIETAETRKRIVATASRLFLEQGLAATGIAEIMAAVGLTQGGFYRHFETKEQLIAEASEVAFEQIFKMIEAEVEGLSPRDTLDTMVHIYLYQRQRKSAEFLCPLAHLGSELPHAEGQVRAIVDIGHQRMVTYVAALLQKLNIVDDVGVANAIVATMLGAVTISRLSDASSSPVLANAQDTVNLILKSAEKTVVVA